MADSGSGISFWQHLALVLRKAFEDVKWIRDTAMGGVLSIAGLALQVWWSLIAWTDWRIHKWQWIGTIVLPVTAIVCLDIARRIAIAPWRLYGEQARQHREELRASEQVTASLRGELAELKGGVPSLEEHDPKVYLDPLNEEFPSTGIFAFEISNRGQRVNMAHAITIQPIEALPDVFFEYVDHLDMAERKKIFPKIRGANLFSSGDILRDLARAFDADGNMYTAELPFEVVIKYEDATRRKKFESVVRMVYSPVEEQHVRRSIGKNVTRREYKIVRVVDTLIRRVA